jgi:hypothetical protein
MERVILITILLVFCIGYALCAWGVPFLDNVFNTIAVFFQLLQGKMAVKITADSVKAAKLKEALNKDGENTRVIGFALPNPIEEEEDEEYEDDE